MRPTILDPWFADLGTLRGIGPKLRPLLERLLGRPVGGGRLVDLLLLLPITFVDRTRRTRIADAPDGAVATLEVTVTEHRPPPPGRFRAPFRVLVEDDSGDVSLVFFNAARPRIAKMLPIGARRLISGKVEFHDGYRQIVHPDYVAALGGEDAPPEVEPVYPLTEGVVNKVVRRAEGEALARVAPLPEWQDGPFLRRERHPPFLDALRALHRPQVPADLDPMGPARRRLAYDELFATQLALALVRARFRRLGGRPTGGDGHLVAAILAALSFRPTGAQARAHAEIAADLAGPHRMLRLLQGDVGSGKTLVALLAMASVAEAGRQSAMMAPTEILARQHHTALTPLAAAAGLRVELLTGRDRPAERARVRAALASGEVAIAVGTHALFQEGVEFADLALAVIDEQHRFGVNERFLLQRKGAAVDVLVMTATPIPRTLLLASHGDMDASVLGEKPPGRQPITTRAVTLDRLDEVVGGLERALARGERAYWICPLVEESETIDLAAAEARFATLRDRLGERVGLVHGRLKGPEKDAAMAAFQRGDVQLLVATTVVEVGVDVPEATIMVIERAETFGLAQLHQLRGRVGRGAGASTCLLLYKAPLSEAARTRLDTLRRTEDGFEIAEMDLKLRGPGEVLGRRQSGLATTRLARMDLDGDLLETARDDARLVLEMDPELAGPRGQALRVLLYLFERDEAVRLLRGG